VRDAVVPEPADEGPGRRLARELIASLAAALAARSATIPAAGARKD